MTLFVFGPSTGSLSAAVTIGALTGLFSNSCAAGRYAIAPPRYAPSVRAAGVGRTIGAGRE